MVNSCSNFILLAVLLRYVTNYIYEDFKYRAPKQKIWRWRFQTLSPQNIWFPTFIIAQKLRILLWARFRITSKKKAIKSFVWSSTSGGGLIIKKKVQLGYPCVYMILLPSYGFITRSNEKFSKHLLFTCLLLWNYWCSFLNMWLASSNPNYVKDCLALIVQSPFTEKPKTFWLNPIRDFQGNRFMRNSIGHGIFGSKSSHLCI